MRVLHQRMVSQKKRFANDISKLKTRTNKLDKKEEKDMKLAGKDKSLESRFLVYFHVRNIKRLF